MHKRIIPYITTKIYRFITLFVLAVVLGQVSAFAQSCVSVINSPASPIAVNGIVVGTAVTGGGGLPAGCAVDPGWGGVASQDFTVFGAAGTRIAKIFLAGYNAAPDLTLDTIYLGVHIEGDPDLREKDRLVLYFDANGNNNWDDNSPDFALLYEVGTATPPSNETCDQKPGFIQFYRRSGGTTWTPQAIPAGITSKVSWDYSTSMPGDAETGIWELEIGIDVAGLGLAAPATGTGFKVGAKLYIHEIAGGDTWTVWKWPGGLTMESSPLLFDPNEGNVTPANLEQPNIGSCGFDVKFDPDPYGGVTATSNTGLSNQFTILTNADFSGQTPLKQNHFTARAKFYNPANLADNSPVAVPNTGNVKFSIRPWNGNFLGEYLMAQPSISFNQLNQIRVVTLDWPPSKDAYDNPVTHQPKNDLANSQHTCLKVEFSGFATNSNTTNDLSTRNLTYVSASTVKDSFLISTRGVELPSGQTTLEYILRVQWQNISEPEKNKWSYRFPNAERIGLKDLKNGYFSLPMKLGDEKRVDVEITGGIMPVPTKQYQLSPRAGGKILSKPSGEGPLEIEVKPGKMVTIIAHGLINVEPKNERIRPNSPNGFLDREQSKLEFLLSKDFYDPSENIGALVGSFNDFKTAFVIGADKTFLVPEGTKKLSLAINDIAGAYDDNDGKGFELNVVTSEPLFLPTRLAEPGNPQLGLPALPRAGSNLPELDIDVAQAVPVKEKEVKLLRPTGYVAYAVYASHPGEEGTQPRRGLCGRTTGKKFALSSFLTIIGLVVLRQKLVQKNKSNDR